MSSENKIAIKLGADYSGGARLINTMVWGDPSTLALLENGELKLMLPKLEETKPKRIEVQTSETSQMIEGEIADVENNKN